MSGYKIVVPNEGFEFKNLSLVSPITVNGGTFFTKLLNNDNELYIQTPICSSKNGFIKTQKKISCDLLFEKSNTEFIEWFENLESVCQKMIFEKSKEWFQDEIELDDIENAFTSSIRSYKSGSYHLIKTTTESPRLGSLNSLSIYDQQERQIKVEDVPAGSSMICVLQIHGVKFTQKNFQIFIQLKQVMILNDNLFDVCQIKPNIPVKTSRKISLKANENDLESDNSDEDIENEYIQDDSKTEVNEVDIDNEQKMEESNELSQHLEKDEDNQKNLEKELDIVEEIEEKKDVGNIEEMEVDDLENNLEKEIKLEEVNLTCDTENLETITLKKPDEVYLEIYNDARQKAKRAKKEALLSYLELHKIQSEYSLDGLDASDDEIDKAIKKETLKINDSKTEEKIM